MKKMKKLKKNLEEIKSSLVLKDVGKVIKPGQVVLIQVIKEEEVERCCSYNFYFFEENL